ncbi:hypothetical protein GCM10022234_11190 [Aeromicrobium panaciterrae]
MKSLGSQANKAAGDLAAKVDDQTGEAAKKAADVIALAVRLARIPTALILCAPIPFIIATAVMGLLADGGVRWVILAAAVVMLVVSGAFWGRRRRIIHAVEEPDKLATELGIMISMTDKVEETRGALSRIAGAGGWRIFSRLKGLWSGMAMTSRWIEGIGDLPRARYFGPPKIGTTVTVAVAALWLVPISIVVALVSVIGTIAGSI